MDILGIGPLELVFILIILLVVMGPRDIVKSSKVVGRILRQIMTSPTFKLVQDTSREIRNLPYRLARESGIDELQAELKSYTDLPKISPFPTEDNKPDLGTWEAPSDSTDAPREESPAARSSEDTENPAVDGDRSQDPSASQDARDRARGQSDR